MTNFINVWHFNDNNNNKKRIPRLSDFFLSLLTPMEYIDEVSFLYFTGDKRSTVPLLVSISCGYEYVGPYQNTCTFNVLRVPECESFRDGN